MTQLLASGDSDQGLDPATAGLHRRRRDDPAARSSTPVSVDVARRVVARLLRDGYRAGDRLPSERQLAAELHVGRSVVREALRSLSLLGVLDLRPGHGTYLTAVSSEPIGRATELGQLLGTQRIHDLSAINTNLEAVMADLAAVRRTEGMIRDLDDNQAALEGSLEQPARLLELHRDSHALVWAAAGNTVLAQVLGGICSLLDHALGRAIAVDPDRAWIVHDHQVVLEAIRYRDNRRARVSMQEHMARISGRLAPIEGPE